MSDFLGISATSESDDSDQVDNSIIELLTGADVNNSDEEDDDDPSDDVDDIVLPNQNYALSLEEIGAEVDYDIQFGTVTRDLLDSLQVCVCYSPVDETSALSLCSQMLSWVPTKDNVTCIIDNLQRCANLVLKCEFEDPRRLAFVDLYFRLRHEVLFKLLLQSLNLPTGKSDKEFSLFGLPSTRTPDFIEDIDGTLIIIEVGVTSNYERMAKTKGSEVFGYQSKYESELIWLRDNQRQFRYFPVIFDVSNVGGSYKQDIDNLSHFFKINSTYTVVLDNVLNMISRTNLKLNDVCVAMSPLLFKKFLPIPDENEEWSNFFSKEKKDEQVYYEEFTISNQVFSTFHNKYHYIPKLIDQTYDNKKYFICLSLKSNRLIMVKDNNGFTLDEIQSRYDSNDKKFFYYYLLLETAKGVIKARDSDTGVTFTYKVTNDFAKKEKNFDEFEIASTHKCNTHTGHFKLSDYERVMDLHYNETFTSVHYDANYEDLLIEKISEFDHTFFNGVEFTPPNEKMLCSMKMHDGLALNIIEKCTDKFIQVNDFETPGLPLKVKRLKQPFIYPIADLCSKDYEKLENKNLFLANELMLNIQQTDPYTTAILQKFIDPSYTLYTKPSVASKHLNELYERRRKVGSELTRLYKSAIKGLKIDEVHSLGSNYSSRLDETDKNDLSIYRAEMSKLSKEIRIKEKEEGVRQNIGFARLPTKKKNSFYRHLWRKEMQHFKNKNIQSAYEGIGLTQDVKKEHIINFNIYNTLISTLLDFRGVNNDKILHDHVSDDAALLKELKESALDLYRSSINNIVNSSLGHATALISRIGHTLLYMSQLSFNGDYIRIDNLGYKNVLIMIKGGKKVFNTKCSKLFRLLIPISDEVLPWYSSTLGFTSSFTVIKISSRNFLLTPWQMWNETILTDSLSFHNRVCSFVVLNLDPKCDLKLSFHSLSMNVLLAFHNRRKTESMLANLRYILVATMGEYSGISEIFDEFVSFNTDHFNSFCKTSVLMNYPQYYTALLQINKATKKMDRSVFERNNVINIFTRCKINKPEDVALMIYSTFLMSKAPYQKINERANNLIGVLKIHDEYTNLIGENLSIDQQNDKCSVSCDEETELTQYVDQLFGTDFNYDPKYVACVGNFTNSYFKNKGLKDKIHAEWLKILSMPYDKVAASSGLRGEIGTADFWGKKGYFVVYKQLVKDKQYMDKITDLIQSTETDHEKNKMLNKLNMTFMQKIENNTSRNSLLFHVVDKVQWRGGREIYVMDLYTKTLQQPIEKFAGFLCENIDNELISIPSDKRAQVIHHQLFEKDLPLRDMLSYFITLDCRKWAPKSLITKLIVFILNIEILPSSFKKYFMNYCQKLYHKKIYFQKGEVKQLENNMMYKELISKYCIYDKSTDAYFLEMNYSWVMGIFNYVSSFLHAMNQLYAGYLIKETAMKNLGEEIAMTMYAHSDDSSGRILCSNKGVLERCLFHYEWMLKSCNHLLSRKKSLVSRLYYEMLSIIYIGKELLSLMPKFSGGIKFSPTDKGMSQDLLQSYSKCNEILIAGGTFTQCYLVLKIHSFMVFKFYMNRDPVQSDYLRPPQFLGMPDAHPLLAILVGSDCDALRMITTDEGKQRLIKLTAITNKLIKPIDEPGCIRPLRFKIMVKGLSKDFDLSLENFKDVLSDWSINNVNFKNTAFNFLNFLCKLSDPGFVGSLTNESTTRRLSRCYWMRNNDCVILNHGTTKIKRVILAYEFVCAESHLNFNEALKKIVDVDEEFEEEHAKILETVKNDFECFQDLLSGPIKLYKYFNQLSIKDKPMKPIIRTIKPTHLQLIKTGKPFSVSFDAAQLVSYVKGLPFNWAFTNTGRLNTAAIELRELLKSMGLGVDSIDINMLHKLCKNYVEKNVKDIYLYSQIPTDIRVIKTYSSFLNFLASNSHANIEIHGITLELGSKITDPSYVKMQIDDDTYTVMTILSLLLTLSKTDRQFVNSLTLNEVKDIGFAGGTVTELIQFLENWKFKNPDYSFIRLPLKYLNEYILGYDNEVSSDVLLGSCYYVFLKEQRINEDWRGSGQLLIVVDQVYYIFEILNDKLLSVVSNFEGKVPKFYANFIIDVLIQNGIRVDQSAFQKTKDCNSEKLFGYDYGGDLCLTKKQEITIGISAKVQDVNIELMHSTYKFKIKYVRNSLFIAQSDGLRSYKVYSIKPKVIELAMIAKEIFNPADFELKLQREGLDNFEEFLYTELLVSMGARTYISFKEWIDNAVSSRLFHVITSVLDNEDEDQYMPNKFIVGSKLPAGSGSLLKILFKYSELTGEQIVTAPTKITSDILAIRNEYPESFTIILQDKMKEAYTEIYSISEQREIAQCYMTLTEIEDPERLRNTILNYMSIWGYESFNNFLASYSFIKDTNSYNMFTFKTVVVRGFNYFADQFEFLFKTITSMIKKYEFSLRFFDQECQEAGLNIDYLTKLAADIAYSAYDYKIPFTNSSISYFAFLNMLHVCLKNIDFCAELETALSGFPALNSLPIDYNYRKQLIATFNYLMHNWLEVNKQHTGYDPNTENSENPLNEFELKPWLKLQTLPRQMQVPKKLVSKLNDTKFNVYHHNFLTSECFPLFETGNMGEHIETDKHVYSIRNKISELSPRIVPVNRYLQFLRPIEHRTLGKLEELFEELKYEENEEQVEEMLQETEIVYKNSPTKIFKKNKNIRGDKTKINTLINWVFKLGGIGAVNVVNRINQIGENVVLISPFVYDEFTYLHNAHIRLVNLDCVLKRVNTGTPLVCHIRCCKKLNLEFWNKYLPGQIIHAENFSSLGHDLIIDIDYNVKPFCQKMSSQQFKLKKGKEDEEKKKKSDEEAQRAEEERIEKERILSERLSAEQKEFVILKEEFETAYKEGMITKGFYTHVCKFVDKHIKAAESMSTNPIYSLINNIMKTKFLQIYNNETLTESLTREQYIKIYQAPSHFGLAHGYDTPSDKNIKDEKIRAELNSLDSNLLKYLASGTLTISENMLRLLKSNVMLWDSHLRVNPNIVNSTGKDFLLLLLRLISTDAIVVTTNEHDNLWQNIINTVTIEMAAGCFEEKKSEKLEYRFKGMRSASRLKYKASGF